MGSGNYRRMAVALRQTRKDNEKLALMLQACHEANLLRRQALLDAGIPDPVEEEE